MAIHHGSPSLIQYLMPYVERIGWFTYSALNCFSLFSPLFNNPHLVCMICQVYFDNFVVSPTRKALFCACRYKLAETENSLFKFIIVMLSFKLLLHYSLLLHAQEILKNAKARFPSLQSSKNFFSYLFPSGN